MSNYTKTTDFEAKDSLPSGDSGKIIKGAEFETEFDNIATAVATKADTAGPTFTGTLTYATLNDGTTALTSTVAELNALDGITSTVAELNYSDTGAAVGTVVASKVVTVDSNKDVASFRNITLTGELDAGSLDISGNADIDGTLEADAITINGATLSETIADTVGAMVTSNTETGITVTYEDADNTLDFVVGTLNQDTTGTAALATSVTVSANNSTDETVYPLFVDGATGTQGAETDTGLTYNPSSGILTSTNFTGALTGNADTATVGTGVTVSANNSTDETVYPTFVDGATGTQGIETDTGLTYNPSTGVLTSTAFTGALTGNVTGNASGTAATVTGAAQSNITSLGTLTTLTVDNVIINGTTIGHTGDTDLMTVASGVLTVAGEVSMTTLDIGGTNVTATAAELNKLASAGTLKQAGLETIYVPASAMYPNTTAGCAALAQVELSNGPELKCLDFDASSDENAQFTVCFPKSWNEGTVTFQAFWTVTGTNTGTVAWGLSGGSMANDASINTAFGTNVVATALAHSGTSNDMMVSATSGAVTIANAAADTMTYFQVMRDVSADAQTGDARLLGIKLFFTTDAANDA